MTLELTGHVLPTKSVQVKLPSSGTGTTSVPLAANGRTFATTLVEDFGRGDGMAAEVRRTLVHEIGHAIGLSHTDRFSDMIVSGGVNIYPAEAEKVIIEHPAVADVAVIGIPDATMGEAVKALEAGLVN